jgi:hypothetical protein
MSDPTPRDIDDATPIEPAPAAAPTAAPAPAAAAKSPWYGRRVPLLISGAALILGCLLGGGVVAIAAFAVDGNHGDDRGSYHSHDERPDGRSNGNGNGNTGRHKQNRDGDDQPTPAPSTSSGTAPATSVPTPSASA